MSIVRRSALGRKCESWFVWKLLICRAAGSFHNGFVTSGWLGFGIGIVWGCQL